jgi:hypothetical protein
MGRAKSPFRKAASAKDGKNLSIRTILTGEVGSPGVAHVFLTAVQDADQKAEKKS